MSATFSNIQEAFNALQDIHIVASGSQSVFPFAAATTGTETTSKEESESKKVLNEELDSVLLSFKTSIRKVLAVMSDDELNRINVQTMAGLFKDEVKTSIVKMAKNN